MRAMGPSSLFLRLLSATLLLASAIPSSAQTAAATSIQSFQLVADQSGFVLANNRLFWTDSLGKQWAEITPPASSTSFSTASFRADGTGYAVGHSPSALTFARTTDDGKSWATTIIASPFTEALQPNGRDSISFADVKNGFLMLGVQSGSAFRFGILLATTDGGSTWTQLPRPPVGGGITFLDAKHGFNGPGPGGDELYTTVDGGTTWQKVSLAAPSSLLSTNSTTALPVFTDSLHGTIIRTFATPSGATTLRYTTTDGGSTWTSFADSTSTRAVVAADGSIAHVAVASGTNASRTSFSNATKGLVLITSGGCTEGVCTQTSSLRATTDGGKTFTAVSPAADLSFEASRTFTVPTTLPTSIAAPTPDSSSVYNTAGVMGFDACSLPTTANLSDWITNSPYRVTSLYMGGANYSNCGNALGSLTSTYVSTVLGQGWQFWPLWVGPQAPESGCSTCSMMSTTPATAMSQGTAEADSAIAALNNLGIGQGTTIVYDMEAYTRDGTSTPATTAFIEGWDTELHSKGYIAGVYSGHSEFTDWYPTVLTPAIDVIWFTYFFSNGVACGAECQTVFPTQSSFDISTNYWLNNHRARQTSSGFNSTYGSTTLNIDEDWVDAPMATNTPNKLTVSVTGTGTVASSTITNSNSDTTTLTSISCGSNCTANFAPTDTIVLTETPSGSATFSGWTGCTSTTATSCTVAMTAAANVTAIFNTGTQLTVSKTGTGTGTVTSSDSTINCGTVCTAGYPPATVVTLTATATNNSTFNGWTGCTTATGATCSVTVGSSAITVTANFLPPTTLTVSKTGTGTGTITSADSLINCGTTCSAGYQPNAVVTLTATATNNSTFNGWTGCTTATGTTCSVTIGSSAIAITANFLPPTTLTVSKTGTGTGTVTSSDSLINCGTICSTGYKSGTVVTLTAAATNNSTFNGWTGCTTSTGTTCSVTIGSTNLTVSAAFLPPNTLTITKAGTGSGTVTSGDTPQSINCGTTCSAGFLPGTTVTLTATPASGSVFTSWSGCTVGASANICTVVMSAAEAVTATFSPGPSFTGTATATSISVGVGASTTDTINLVTANGWTGSFTSFACAGQPATVTCTFNPTSVTATTNTTTPVTLTVAVPSTYTAAIRMTDRSGIVLAGFILPALLLPLAFRRRFHGTRIQKLLLLAFAIAGLGFMQVLTGCGGSSAPATPTGPLFSGTMTVSYTSTQTGGSATTNTIPITLTIPR